MPEVEPLIVCTYRRKRPNSYRRGRGKSESCEGPVAMTLIDYRVSAVRMSGGVAAKKSRCCLPKREGVQHE